MSLDPSRLNWPPDTGLLPAIVQDRSDGRVLMLGWMDREALAATLATDQVHFHSRSRDRLWRKGETSGHVLDVVEIELDCDGDALLIQADPTGPTCHRDTRSCFDEEGALRAQGHGQVRSQVQSQVQSPVQGFAWLETLWTTVADRAAQRPAGSYTASLLDAGVDAAGRKVTEEATEVLIAAKDDASAQAANEPRSTTANALAGEAADLVFHLLVLLAERDLEPTAVLARLRARHVPADQGTVSRTIR
jgi:phosphoribosyl-ATP pyrophosphohydrolase/phosphoribosyl-AMP cyclohydrolase